MSDALFNPVNAVLKTGAKERLSKLITVSGSKSAPTAEQNEQSRRAIPH
jgi:hypothetical protein